MFVTAQCWGWRKGGGGAVGRWAGAKSWTFTIESSGTDKGVLKSIAGKQTDACLKIPSAAEHPCRVCETRGADCCCHQGVVVVVLCFFFPSSSSSSSFSAPTIEPASQSCRSAGPPHSPSDTKSCCFSGKTCLPRKTCWQSRNNNHTH